MGADRREAGSAQDRLVCGKAAIRSGCSFMYRTKRYINRNADSGVLGIECEDSGGDSGDSVRAEGLLDAGSIACQ